MAITTEDVAVPFGDQIVQVKLPEGCLRDNAGMAIVPPAADPIRTVERALTHPIESEDLVALARQRDRVTIVVDDLTRPTPIHLVLPPVLDRLREAGVPTAAITILVATGTHRPMTGAELRSRLGDLAVDGYRVVNHDYRKVEDLVDLGNT